MVDVLTKAQRRLNMRRIRGHDTKPEMALRSALHAQGLRFRLHRRELPGRPDIVFAKVRVAVFVDGCFWHGCPIHGAKPKTNRAFWLRKLRRNVERDREISKLLKGQGWKVFRVWEHDIERDLAHVIERIARTVQQRKERV